MQIEDQAYVNSKKTGKLDTCLDETLLLGKGACVMLFKNLDVADGLVNGVCGAVTHSDFLRRCMLNLTIGLAYRK